MTTPILPVEVAPALSKTRTGGSSATPERSRAPRFHSPEPLSAAIVGRSIELHEAAAHHALRVLRLAVGDALTLFDGSGGEYSATLVRVDKRGASVHVDGWAPIERESPLDMTLAVGITANDAMDHALRKATELGVTAIQPVVTERSAPLPPGERADKRIGHWRGIAIAACEQCGRNRIPEVFAPRSLGDWLRTWPGGGIVFVPEAEHTLAALRLPAVPVALLIGPAGGFDTRELAIAATKGFAAVRLGPRVLRTETAAVAGLGLLQALWGDWR